MGVGEIPDGLDAALHQRITDLLGMGRGNSDDTHEHLVLSAEGFQLFHGENGLAAVGVLRHRPDVKGRQNVQTVGFKALVVQQGLAQFAGADHHSIGGVVIAQELLDIIDEVQTVIAHLGPSAAADHGQILADLHLAHTQSSRQRRSGNIGRGILWNALQIGQVSRQALKHRLGDFLAFQHVLSLHFVP